MGLPVKLLKFVFMVFILKISGLQLKKLEPNSVKVGFFIFYSCDKYIVNLETSKNARLFIVYNSNVNFI